MNFVILEQWLTELMPPDHKNVMHDLISCIKEDASLQFLVGMNTLYPSIVSEDLRVKAAALNGLMIGIALSHAWKVNPTLIESSLTGFLESRSKHRGENVFDFLKERAKKQ